KNCPGFAGQRRRQQIGALTFHDYPDIVLPANLRRDIGGQFRPHRSAKALQRVATFAAQAAQHRCTEQIEDYQSGNRVSGQTEDWLTASLGEDRWFTWRDGDAVKNKLRIGK